MSTEIALRDTDSWADILPAVGELAGKIASTSFVPKSLRGKTAETAACILTGRELGIGPMESLQKIHVIDGRPSLSSELMRSLVLRAGHSIRFSTLTDKTATIEGRRQGEEQWTSITWTIADAQRIGVTGKDIWKKYPRTMLANRATSELCRMIFPDALGGISMTPEEIEDENVPTVTITREPSRVSRAKAEPPVTPEPDVEAIGSAPVDVSDAEDITDAVVVSETEAGITDAQQRKLRVLMKEVGMSDRDAILGYVSGVVGRTVESSTGLTKGEATTVIEALGELAAMATATSEPPLDES